MSTKYFNLQNEFKEDILIECVNQLKNDNIGIFPTDTVYGIGCNSLSIDGINKLYKAKGRNYNKPINILVSNIEMVKQFVENINHLEEKLMKNFWPGDLTIIFNKSKLVPDILTSGLNTIGIRMPNNKICLNLIDKLGFPIAASSANISDQPPATYIDDTLKYNFNDKVSFILDGGEITNGIPSTIITVENDTIKILREGSITLNEIMEVLKNVR